MPATLLPLREAARLLLQAATVTREEGLTAWSSWLEANRLDDIEPASFTILPAISRNLEHQQAEHPEAGRLRGVYRYAWAQNQLTYRDLSVAVPALVQAGVPVIAHRGLPVIARYCGDFAALIADQVDLLVASADLDRAIAALAPSGWVPSRPLPPPSVRPAFQSLPLAAPGRRRLLLHWRCLPFGSAAQAEEQIHARAMSTVLQGLELLTPDPIDQAIIGLAQLPDLAPSEYLRWVVQESAVHRAVAQPAELARRAEDLGLGDLRIGKAAAPPTHPGLATRVLRALPRTWQRYQGVCRATERAATPWGFLRFAPTYYRYAWRLPQGGSLPRSAIQRVLSTPEPADAGLR